MFGENQKKQKAIAITEKKRFYPGSRIFVGKPYLRVVPSIGYACNPCAQGKRKEKGKEKGERRKEKEEGKGISGVSVSVYCMLFSCILLVRLFLAKTTSYAREARHTIPKI